MKNPSGRPEARFFYRNLTMVDLVRLTDIQSVISNETRKNRLGGNMRPLVIEIAGLAGAGKTTLIRDLSQRNNQIQVGVELQKIKTLPAMLSDALFFLPTYLRRYRHSRWFTWQEARSMVYLKAWHRALTQQPPKDDAVVVFDHGPIFRLALLREFGPEITRSQLFEQWWENVLNLWMNTLDIIVWLEAPFEVLLERTQRRGHWYLSRGISIQEGYEFLARYENVYEQIIARCPMNQGPTLLHFTTEQKSPDQIAEEVLSVLDSKFY
jgi:deoxyadenosine/deoxycytidine kinase